MPELYDHAAEVATIGAAMMSPTALWEVVELVRPEDFSVPRHVDAMEAIATLAQRGEGVSTITVLDELTRSGRLRETRSHEGGAWLLDTTTHVPTSANAGAYAAIVRDWAVRRRLHEAGLRIVQSAESGEGDPTDLVAIAREGVDSAAAEHVAVLRGVDATLDGLVQELTEAPRVQATPWYELNRLIGGLRPGSLVVVGARPGVGKTVVGLQLAVEAAQYGPVAFASLEMSERELQRRLLAQLGLVSMAKLAIGKGAITEQDWRSIAAARQIMQSLELFVEDQASSLAQVMAFARTVHRRGRMQALVIDYLQLMAGVKAENRQQEVAVMSRTLKRLAMTLGIPVIALSQLNRRVVDRQKGKQAAPALSDLRESGAIEQDADVVLLLDRAGPDAQLKVSVAKNRHGREGEFALDWEGHYARAVSRTKAHGGDEPLGGMEDAA